MEALKKKPQSVDDFIDIFNSARYPRNFDVIFNDGRKETIKVSKKSFSFKEEAGLPINFVSDEILDDDTLLGVVIFDLNNKKIIHLDNNSYGEFLRFMYIDINREHPPAKKKWQKCAEKEGIDPNSYPKYATKCYREAYWLEVEPPKDFTTRYAKFSKPKHRDAVMRELFDCDDPSGEFYRSVGACL